MPNPLEGARYVGSRHWLPEGMSRGGVHLHAVAVDHPAGSWDAIFCRTEEQAQAIVRLSSALDDSTKFCSGDFPCEASTAAASLERERNDLRALVTQLCEALRDIAGGHCNVPTAVLEAGQAAFHPWWFMTWAQDHARAALAAAAKVLKE